MPTLSLSTAAPSLVPPPLAANPVAPAPAGETAGDAFAAMLAGLTTPPIPEAAQPATMLPAAGVPLPQVRQDPAAWLPDESPEVPVEITSFDPVVMGGGGESPTPQGLRLDVPDCEMPAELEGLPVQPPVGASLPAELDALPIQSPVRASLPPELGALPTQPPARASLPAIANPEPPLTKGWTLRLSSALTPARAAASIAPEAEPVVEASPSGEKPKLEEPLPPEHVLVEAAVEMIAQPAPLPVPVETQPQLTTPQPIAVVMPAPAIESEEFAPVTGPSLKDEQSSPSIAAPQIRVSPDQAADSQGGGQSRSDDGRPSFVPELVQQAEQATTPTAPAGEAELADARPSFAPDLMKRIEQAIELRPTRTESEPVEAASAPVQPSPPLSASAGVQAPATPVSAPSLAQPAPVDVSRAEWAQAMIDRIAELPQAEGRREAQIRLIPDALGKVDVSIVQRDDQMQVTLNAETAPARQLLAEAAPRLQEMAEARGLRLADPQVGGGQSQDRRQSSDQQQSQTPQRPRSASANPDDDPQPQRDLVA